MKSAVRLLAVFLAFALLGLAQSPASEPAPLPPPTAAADSAPANVAPPDYRLGPGDMIALTAYGTPEFDRTVTVGADGGIVLTYLAHPLPAADRTSAEVASELAAALKAQNLVLDPQVDAAVVQAASHVVTVGGAVQKPTVLYLTRPITLQDALVRAGGTDLDKAGATVSVTASGITRLIPYAQIVGGDPQSNVMLEGGERVDVASGGEVFVAGAVKEPGAFPITAATPLTASRAIALAKGWELVGSRPDKATIVRRNRDGSSTDIPVNLAKVMDLKAPDPALQANDVLLVPGNLKAHAAIAVGSALVNYSAYALALVVTR